MFSSEQKFSINGSDKEILQKAVKLALDISGSDVQSFNMDGHGITFYWFRNEGNSKMPKTKNAETILNLAWDYINSEEARESFSKEPHEDIDGSIERGWEIYLPRWDEDSNHFYAIFKIKLAWLYYHK